MQRNEFEKTEDFNQKIYSENPGLNAKFDEYNSTIYLVYRDIPEILDNHILKNVEKGKKIRVLDYGCGDGLSAKIILKILSNKKYQCEMHGVDINETQIESAKKLVPEGSFSKISLGESLDNYRDFDLVICNFVLLEHIKAEMVKIPNIIYPTLKQNGIAVFTNNTSNVYHPDNTFYNVRSRLPLEKLLKTSKNGKRMPLDSEEVPVEVTEKDGKKIEYKDYFYSGKTYVKTFFSAGFSVPETWKPTAKNDEHRPWKAEDVYSDDKPMYRIDVCKKDQLLQFNKKVTEEKMETDFGKRILRK